MSTELAVTANNQARCSAVRAGTPVAMLRQSVAGSVDAANDEDGPMVAKMAEEAGDGEVEGSARIRIQPLDTRLRLHFKQTQGFSMRSRVNFGKTHMMASHPGPVNLSTAKLVESGMTYVEARKKIARATREAHQQFVREGEQQLAKEMSFRDVNERAQNAHTLGTATLTNKIERMHRRGRERQARQMLEWNEEEAFQERQQQQRKKEKSSAYQLRKSSSRGRTVPIGDTPDHRHRTLATTAQEQTQAVSSSSQQVLADSVPTSNSPSAKQPQGDTPGDRKPTNRLITTDLETRHTQQTVDSAGQPLGNHQEEAGVGVDAKDTDGARRKRKGGSSAGDSNDIAFVLRKLYTGGGLDAQQQGWKCMPTNLFNTLTMQLGTLSKINMPRNSLELLISLRNPNFSCAHMRSVGEINLSGNKLRELPEEAQRLTSLKTLRLDNNKLSGLPDGLLKLTSLTHLSLRHNNFSNLPNRFGDLHRLEKLDLGENMLKTLPPTMGLLTSLKHLKLDGNNMPHLAVPPLLKTSNGKDQCASWVKRWNRDKKREMWVNDITGETSDVDPTSSSVNRSSNASAASVNSTLTVGTFPYNRRRNELAARGERNEKQRWEAALNISTGKVYYINNVNFSHVQAMPACMNRLGDMTRLVSLKLSQNKLRSLPSSICWCRNLEVLEANDNYLEKLPARLGEMKQLRHLRQD
ncbi:unnamed protein product [Ectocarpus sp. 6 AP-2014]